MSSHLSKSSPEPRSTPQRIWSGRRKLRALAFLPATETLEVRITPTTSSFTWTGAISASWNDAGNWSGGLPLTDGTADLVFPSDLTFSRYTPSNDFLDGTFNSIRIQSNQYAIAGLPLTLVGGLTASYGSGTAHYNIPTSLGMGLFNVDSGANLEIGGVLSGAGGLTKDGPGSLTLKGSISNTYTGPTAVNDGSLLLGNTGGDAIPGALTVGDGTGTDIVQLLSPNQIADDSAVTLNISSLIDLNNFDDTVGPITMNGATITTGTSGILTLTGDVTTNSAAAPSLISGKLNLGGARTFTVNENTLANPDMNIMADISGTGAGIIKAGPGSLVLAGNNTYDGTTAITAGLLQVDGSLASSNELDVQSDATLGGHGTVGLVDVAPGGNFSPGASPAIITVASLSLTSGSIFTEELNGLLPGVDFDQTIVTTGPVDLGSATLTPTLGVGYLPAPGDVLTIIDNQSASQVTGTFFGLPQDSIIYVGGFDFRVSYKSGDGNDVTLTHVLPTTSSVTSATNPSVFDQSVTFTATVAFTAPGAGTPTGNVDFLDGVSLLGTSALSGLGTATFSTSALSVASHSITVVYAGDIHYAGGTSLALGHVVNTVASVTVGFQASTGVAQSGDAVTFTTVVSSTIAGGPLPTGTVVFYAGASPVATVALANGQAVYTTSLTGAGSTQVFHAAYSGDSNYPARVSANASVQVVKAYTRTTVVAEAVFNARGRIIGVNVFANVTRTSSGLTVPSGPIMFFINNRYVTTQSLSNGTASRFFNFRNVRSKPIYVKFMGNSENNASRACKVYIGGGFPKK